jgi:predicted amidophosphoribosyltransferase
MFGIGHWEMLILGMLCILPAIAMFALILYAYSRVYGNPNLMACPDCRRMISRLAPFCPKCGRPMGK